MHRLWYGTLHLQCFGSVFVSYGSGCSLKLNRYGSHCRYWYTVLMYLLPVFVILVQNKIILLQRVLGAVVARWPCVSCWR